MGWRADKGYEEARQEGFREWRASLTRREYWSWQWHRHRHFLTGAVTAAVWGGILWWLLA